MMRALKNAFLLFLVRLFQKAHKNKGSLKKILVVSTTALGDNLWMSPSLESLRISFPNAFIALLTSSIGQRLYQNCPWIDQIYKLEEPLFWNFFSLRKKLSKESFDTVLFFHASQRLTLPLVSSIGAAKIVGTRGLQKGLDTLLTHPLEKKDAHEIARRLQMVEEIGGKISSEELTFFFDPKEEKTDLPFPGKWVAIHPGSKDRFKRWPKEYFALVANRLKKELGCEILLTGNEEEKPLLKSLQKEIEGAFFFEKGLSLNGLAHILNQVELFISNDTGPFHLASALKRPCIGIYVPTDPNLCGPYKEKNSLALSKKATCSPCLKRKCRRPFCFLQISPTQVFEEAIKKLLLKT